MKLEKYIGHTLQIVYVDRRGQITQRNIEVKSLADGQIRAYCLTSKGPRVFAIENILAFELVHRYAG
ncbi:hypothetical protein I8J29_16580 [Paenibacillus sp. MWE-103]|uniref:WYL domain-containing protein n=1 Tax=Paenibacillus artemisiicola TaxID=1172618 RepID=A0ABS3WCH6_9BACL|nr:hypothetical protein [Paenibacillus artemisiicola]MBO7745826.1 hypothetical protein [Paenibacillus artemisiicola]